ncbi:MAG: trypsin-like peptidase domain-containing protein [Pirellulales bacterium]|nr:trypsin-like peptidase domain-containing protein [Pirellulales bacterium]
MKFAFATAALLASLAFSGIASARDSILINFSSDHCAHCRAMEPTLSQLERSGVPVRHVNVAAEPDLVRRFGIRQTPTFVVVSSGKEVTRLVGTQTLAELRTAIAIDPSGPLIPTGSISKPEVELSAPRTRLAPIGTAPIGTAPIGAAPIATAAGHQASAPRSESMPSLTRADAVERAKAATVRLRVYDGQGYGVGTGTIIDTHGDDALVLTCGHLFRDTRGKGRIEVELFVGGQTRTVAGKLVDYEAEHRDIALVEIRPGFPVPPIPVIPSNEQVRSGQPAFSFGCDRGADPSRRDTRITGVNKYDQHLGMSNLEIAGAPIDGRSGGGLFDDRGRLIGVCNAADYKGDVGIYAGPGAIQWQLDRVNLASLYQPMAAGSPPAERIASLPGANLPVSLEGPAEITRPISAPIPGNRVPGNQVPGNQVPGNQEVIVIVRDRGNPNANSRVMTLDNPSADLMNLIQQQSR